MKFLLRRLLISLVVLGVVFFVGNVVATRFAEDRIAQAAQTSFDLADKPAVQIDGFPVLVRVLSGSLPGISFEAGDVSIQGLRFREVVVRMRDVKADGGLLRTGGLRITIGRGEVRGEASDDAITAFIREQGQDATIEFHDNRRATVRTTQNFGGRRREVVAEGRVELLEGRQQLRFSADSVTVDGDPPGAFEDVAKRRSRIVVDIPRLPGGFRITTVQSGEGFVAFAAVFEDLDFPSEDDEA